jgi:hypothetical protein
VDEVMITLFHNMIEWVKKAILLIRAIIGRCRRNNDNTLPQYTRMDDKVLPIQSMHSFSYDFSDKFTVFIIADSSISQ